MVIAEAIPLVSCGEGKPTPPEPSSSFTWNLDKDKKTATIKQFIGSETDIVIPKEYKAPDGLTYSVTGTHTAQSQQAGSR